MNNIVVRKAKVSDAEGIVSVTTYTWMSAYKGLMPDKVLDSHLAAMEERIPKTKKWIRETGNTFVAKNNGEIIGTVRYGESRNKDFSDCGEIYALYVAEDYQGMGLGKKLFLAAFKELSKQYNSIILNVLKGNKAINFYKKYGGVEVGTRHDDFYGIEVTEIIMYFDSIKTILQD